GAILPGISSGVLCVVFGIYEKLLDSILNFFNDVKKNVKFLFPILFRIGFGVLIFINVLSYLLYYFPIHTKSIFVVIILACIPTLIKDVNSKKSFKLHYIIYTLIALLIGFLSVYLEKTLCIANNIDSNFFYLMFCGFAMSIGIVVPGVSSTIILM